MLRGGWGPGTVLRLIWRGGMVAGLIGLGALEVTLRRPKTREARAMWVHALCGRIIRALGVVTEVEGTMPRTGALILNHQGYLDILVLLAKAPCVFVSKAEVGRWPLVGPLVTMAGTVFVERGAGGSAAAASVGMRAAAAAGLPVVFFPEGTTSDGTGVLPFRSGLLAEAREAGLGICPAVMQYSVAGPQGATVGDDVAYWGDNTLLKHMARFLTLEGVRARLRFGSEDLVFTTEERKAAAAEARAALLQLSGGTLRAVEAKASQLRDAGGA